MAAAQTLQHGGGLRGALFPRAVVRSGRAGGAGSLGPGVAGQGQRGADFPHPQLRRATTPAGKTLDRRQRPFVAGQLLGDRRQHVVRQHGHGRDVALAGHPIAGQPQFPADHELLRAPQLADALHGAPLLLVGDIVCARGVGEPHCLGFLSQPFDAVEFGQRGGQGVGKLHQKLDVQCGVIKPLGGQGPRRPVLPAVALRQCDAEEPFGHGRKVDFRQPQQAAGDFGVDESVRMQPQVGQARQVGHRGVDDPVKRIEVVGQPGIADHSGHRLRIDEKRAGAVATQLDQKGAVVVTVGGGALGVDGQRSGARRQKPSRVRDVIGGDQNIRGSATWGKQRRAHEKELNPQVRCGACGLVGDMYANV